MSLFAPRDAQTSLKCEKCGQPLHIRRSCREVDMHCPACGATHPLKEYINKADASMEHFLENVYCDRI